MATTANGAVKPEPGVPGIKVEGEDGINTAPTDPYEDDPELYIPPEDAAQSWLVKVPHWLWEAWSQAQDSAEDDLVEIGKVRVYQADDASQDALDQKIELRLDPSKPQHANIPKNFNLKLNTQGYNNTTVFSEKDLPGHRPQKYGSARAHTNKPKGIASKGERYGQNQAGAKGPMAGYRSGIPKQVALAPPIQHEAIATALMDDSWRQFEARRMAESFAPAGTTQFVQGIQRKANSGREAAAVFDNFTSTAKPVKGKSKKAQKEKAVRMPMTELTDALYQCFRQYKYWPLRVLRNTLNQPEAYIKEALEQVATLVRSGDMANSWKLKPEYAAMADVKDEDVKDEVVKPEPEDEDMGTGDEMDEDDDDDDDGGMEFEDV
ncbi:hypothetical protein MBLNU230_g4627t1 [Neophaeotheca triangularis]